MEQFTSNKRVYAHFRKRQNDDIVLPQILLQGKYLESAGFEVGDHINIKILDGVITIKKRM